MDDSLTGEQLARACAHVGIHVFTFGELLDRTQRALAEPDLSESDRALILRWRGIARGAFFGRGASQPPACQVIDGKIFLVVPERSPFFLEWALGRYAAESAAEEPDRFSDEELRTRGALLARDLLATIAEV